MASIIRIKRSSGTNKPSSLNWGELAYVTGIGSYGGLNQYKDRIFVGDDGNNVNPVGGYYYASMMEHQPGTIAGVTNTRNSDGGIIAILDSNNKVDQWNVDNLRLDLNTLSSTNTDGDIVLDPNGTGEVNIVDDTYLSFGNDKDVKLRYDEASDNRFEIEGADWDFADGVSIRISDTSQSYSPNTGALVVAGGIGVGSSLTVQGDSILTGDLKVNGGDIVSDSSTFNLLNSNVTRANVLGSGTDILIGDITGVTTIRNSKVEFPNATIINLGSESSPTTVSFQSTTDTSQVSIAATTPASSTSSGALIVSGGVGIASDLYIGGFLNIAGNVFNPTNANFGNISVSGNTTLGDSPTDTVNITGIASITGSLEVDNIKINDNVISTKSGSGDTLYIDPYPDGLSNEGTVIIKGNLQIDGTSTSVNSTTVDINDAIIILGDVTSERTVMETVVSGVSTIRLDSVTGINTGDIVSGNIGLNVGAANTITAYDTVNKIITLTDPTISGIATTAQLTITHAYDTNTDRGVGFNYNTSTGTANNKVGFFGFDDSAIADSTVTTLTHGTHADDSRKWTYVPDATITNSVVTGTKGFLDVKGIYYQSGNFSTNGVVFFDDTGLQRSTNDPASSVITSKQVLTAITKNTLDLGTAITANAGDIIRQDTTGAYGVVESTVSSASSVDLIGVEGTFTTAYNLRLEGQNGFISNLGSIPSTVTVIYTNKPHWTSTLDGGTF